MMFFVIQSLSPNPPTVHQDYSARHDWPVKKVICDLQIRLEGNSKRTSGIRVRWGPEKGPRCCFADVTNREKLRLQRSLGELGDVQMVNSQSSLHPRDIVKSCLFVMPYKLHLLMTTLPIFSTDGLEKTA